MMMTNTHKDTTVLSVGSLVTFEQGNPPHQTKPNQTPYSQFCRTWRPADTSYTFQNLDYVNVT